MNYIKYITFFILARCCGIGILVPYYAAHTAIYRTTSSAIQALFVFSWYMFGLPLTLYSSMILGVWLLIYRWELIKEIIKIVVSADRITAEGRPYIYNVYNFIRKNWKWITQKFRCPSFEYRCIAVNNGISVVLQYIYTWSYKIPGMKYLYHEIDKIKEKYTRVQEMIDMDNIEYKNLVESIHNIGNMMDTLDNMPIFKTLYKEISKNDDILDTGKEIVKNVFGKKNITKKIKKVKKKSKKIAKKIMRKKDKMIFDMDTMVKNWKKNHKKDI